MTTPCLRPDDLPEMASCPADDPRRRHLADCPACRALLHAYDEFMSGPSSDQLEGLDQADGELARRLALVTGRAPGPRIAWGRSHRARSWLLAAAVVLAVVGATAVVRDLMHPSFNPEGPVTGQVRGEVAAAQPGWHPVDGGWRLTWPQAPGTHQEVVFLAADLTDLGRRPLDGGLDVAAVPRAAVYVQLVALAGTDTLARSSLLAARPPSR